MSSNIETVLIKRIRSLSEITPETKDFVYTLDSKDGVWRVRPSTIGRKDIRDGRLFYIANFEFDAPISFEKVWHHDRPSGINATAVFRFRLRIGASGDGGFEQWLAANQSRDEVTIGDLVADVHSALEAYFKHGIDANSLDLILTHRFEAFIDSKKDADRLLPKWLDLIEIKDLYATPLPTEEEIKLEEEKRHRAELAKRLRDIDDQFNVQIALNKLDDAEKEYKNRCELREKLHEQTLKAIEIARRKAELELEEQQTTTEIEKERLKKAVAETEKVYAEIKRENKRLEQEIKESNARIVLNSWWFKLLHSTYSHFVLGVVLFGVVVASVAYIFKSQGREEMLRKCDALGEKVHELKCLGYSEVRFGFTNEIAKVRRLCDSQRIVFHAVEAKRLMSYADNAIEQLERASGEIDPRESDYVADFAYMRDALSRLIEIVPDRIANKEKSKRLRLDIDNLLKGMTYCKGQKQISVLTSDKYEHIKSRYQEIMEFNYYADLAIRLNRYSEDGMPMELIQQKQTILRRLQDFRRDADYFKDVLRGENLCDTLLAYPVFMIEMNGLDRLVGDMQKSGCPNTNAVVRAKDLLMKSAQKYVVEGGRKFNWDNLIAEAGKTNATYALSLEVFKDEIGKLQHQLISLYVKKNWSGLQQLLNANRDNIGRDILNRWEGIARIVEVDCETIKMIGEIKKSEPAFCRAFWDFYNNQSSIKLSRSAKDRFGSGLLDILKSYPKESEINASNAYLRSLDCRGIDEQRMYFNKGLLLEMLYLIDKTALKESDVRAAYEKAPSIGESWYRLSKIAKWGLYGNSSTLDGKTVKDVLFRLRQSSRNCMWLDERKHKYWDGVMTRELGI